MHDSTARRHAARLGPPVAACAALLVGRSAAAAEADAASGGGAWIFASIAFVVVAIVSFAAGLWRAGGRSDRAGAVGGSTLPMAPPPSPPSTAEARPRLRQLAEALAQDSRPLLLIETPRSGGLPVLAQANAAGLQQLGLGPEACGRPWAAVESAAPAALRAGLADAAACGAWWLLRDEAAGACLALGPDGGAEAETASLVYTVSHDLRAPIRVVEGFTRIVKEDYGRQLDRVGNDHLDRVLAAGARMNQMIDAVLTMARLASQPLARQPVDLSQLASFIADDLMRAAPERQVEVSIEPGLRARGDPTLLRLVLENLLGNAWKYSAQNPRARIEFAATQADGRRIHVVRDNGAGFDMRAADRLFGLFQRLHSAKDFPGTGVGLASVRRIVQRHGGEVWAESEPGRGAAFYFTLAD
jgi:signal transduction histidine kinase